ncbi:MAG: cation:proton antiporter, partial [Limisphaerales bacterium]
MGVPDLCRRVLKRPALIYSVFVLFGLLLGPFVDESVATMLKQAGRVGFLLLLFEVGLEIDLPKVKELIRPLKMAVKWTLLQYPVLLALAHVAGLDLQQSLLAAAAFTGCSVGMGYHAWKNYPGLTPDTRTLILRVMVVLEMLAILVLSIETVALEKGFGWMVGVKLLGIGMVLVLISRFAVRVEDLFQVIIAKTTYWRVHLLVLLVLVICAVGERLGLSATKTAFFLGLFMSRTRHEGIKLEDLIAPVSQRLLIPIFFFSLGIGISWSMLFSWTGVLAMSTGFLMIGYRLLIQRRLVKTGGDENSFLLFCPNLTIVALAASALLDQGHSQQVASWLLLAGLFTTIPAVIMLPAPVVSEISRET